MKSAQHKKDNTGLSLSRVIQLFLVCLFLLGTLLLFHVSVPESNDSAQASNFNSSGKLPGHVPGLIKTSHLLGPTNPNTSLTLLVGLYPRNPTQLQAFTSTRNSLHLTPDQFIATYSPAQSEQDAVIAYMQQAGFTVLRTFKQRLNISFRGTVGLAEKAFHVQINNYRSTAGRVFYTPTSNPIVPASLAPIIQTIIGLDNAEHFMHPPITLPKHKEVGTTSTSRPHTSSCPTASSGLGYTPAQIARAYNLTGLQSAGFQGAGQTVAVYELDDYYNVDINTYTACYGGSGVHINRISIDGGVGSPGQGAVEVELDMEVILSAAPHLAALDVYEAPNNTFGWIDEWNQIVNDAVPVISVSWGGCESSQFSQAVYTQEHTLLAAAAAQGQSILVASGDEGSNDCGNPTPTTPSVDDPASEPYVTAVGGTSLTLNVSDIYSFESVWNDGSGHGGGGGISSLWLMPSWQQGPGVIDPIYSSGTPCGASSGQYCREVPDVSLDADPNTGYAMYCTVQVSIPCDPNNPWFPIGGTSAAAPMWAAMIALANEKSVSDGHGTLGFLNPLLYQIGQNASGTLYSNDFHDVQLGNNYTTGDGNNEYPAKPTYDMASGWGSYKALSLANDLEKLAFGNTPSPSPTATSSPSPSPSPSPTLTPSPSPTSGNAPVSKTWYFAEGKVGQGFTEFLTIENPDPGTACTVAIQYLLNSGSPITKTAVVAPASRFTEKVNSDLATPSSSSSYKTVSAILNTVNTSCNGVVAERPMYFTHFAGVSSGSDVLGATSLSQSFYFADIPTLAGYSTFITILNPPGNNDATVTATYYMNGSQVGAQSLTVPAGTRGTLIPTHFFQRVIAVITSTQPVVIERPSYFSNQHVGNAGNVSGAASVVGAQNPGPGWLFAEGYTGGQFQEYLVLANFGLLDTNATLVLEYQNGHTRTIPIFVPQQSQTLIDVNNYNNHPVGTCDTSPCQVSQEVSIDVSAPDSIVAEREMFFHYGVGQGQTAIGSTDITGTTAPSSAYTFAEGYTNTGYNEWLTLQNPTPNPESISVTLVNELGRTYTKAFSVSARSRFTVNITALVASYLVYPGDGFQAYEVSFTAESSDGPFVAERPMYWNTGASGTQGGSDIIGYSGG